MPRPNDCSVGGGARHWLVLFVLWLVVATTAGQANGQGSDSGQGSDPILSMLPGLDAKRLQESEGVWSEPPSPEGTAAAAKLLWALERLAPETLESLADQPQSPEQDPPTALPVRVVQSRGRVQHYDAVRLPGELADVLEFDRLYRIEVQPERADAASGEASPAVRLVTRRIPSAWGVDGGVGEPIQAIALEVGRGEDARLFASRLRWYPMSGQGDGAQGRGQVPAQGRGQVPPGWEMLAAAGVDIHALSDVATRNRKPLVAEDHEVFYRVLSAAARVGDDGGAVAAKPTRVDTLEMLKNSADWVGRWIRFDAETARISRVAVTSPKARQMLGRDSYWQVDAFAELTDARVELESFREDGEPLVFENRFPVTLAILELPEWLSQRVGGVERRSGAGRVDMQMLAEPVTVEGFFFRLWSYKSEFTESRGGRQVGPLILAAELRPRAPSAVSASSVASIGWIFAAVIVGAIVIAAGALWYVERRDRQIARQRRDIDVRLPPES